VNGSGFDDWLQNLLPSGRLAILVLVVIAASLIGTALRERWLGRGGASDPAIIDAERPARSRLARPARVGVGVLLAVASVLLVIAAVVRFAVLSQDEAPTPPVPTPPPVSSSSGVPTPALPTGPTAPGSSAPSGTGGGIEIGGS